ncbi:MAG: hypothetical protein IPM69_17445 [Ignavibacteria bacterium]|nr:hypothetical protein [Ignavibacteria bacterium]
MKILITVKAYPAISKKHGETVCTAGITEDGQWIRIYPIPFRLLDYKNRFHKYDWVELDLIRNSKDFRPESYRPTNLQEIVTVGHIETDGNTWLHRREAIIDKAKVYTNLAALKAEAKDKNICTSLAIFKPSKIIDFIYKPVSSVWDKNKLQALQSSQMQCNLFDNDDEYDIQEFEVVDKVPYKFSFRFQDDSGIVSTLMIEDWETGSLYWNVLKKHEGDEILACEDVKKRYFNDFAETKDYYFFLGTTMKHHYKSLNPFVIVGDFRPKYITQEGLF